MIVFNRIGALAPFSRRLRRLLRGLHEKEARLVVRRTGIWVGFGRRGEWKGGSWDRGMKRERGVRRFFVYPLMIKTLSQSCRQPDLVSFSFAESGGCCESWLSLRTQRELI